jgi:phage terminase large subunit GpA-like protein
VHKGRIVYVWVPKRDDLPNEALDCRNYARAALEMTPWLGTKVIARLGAIAEELRVKGEEFLRRQGNPEAKEAPDPDAAPDDESSSERPRAAGCRGTASLTIARERATDVT